MSLNKDQLDSLAVAARAAVFAENGGVPAELTVAQWALESGWGKHQPGNNPFGIKARPGEPHVSKLTTEYVDGTARQEMQDFESFPSIALAFVRHNQLIQRPPYTPSFARYQQDKDLPALVRGIAAHYATAPSYAEMLLAIIRMDAVRNAIATARTPVATA